MSGGGRIGLRPWTGFVATTLLGLAIVVTAPLLFDGYQLLQLTVFAAMAVFALSQGFVWGYTGIMSFGQAASSASAATPTR